MVQASSVLRRRRPPGLRSGMQLLRDRFMVVHRDREVPGEGTLKVSVLAPELQVSVRVRHPRSSTVRG